MTERRRRERNNRWRHRQEGKREVKGVLVRNRGRYRKKGVGLLQ